METSKYSSRAELHASAVGRFVGGRPMLTLITIAVCMFNAFLVVRRLHWHCPLSPWEAGFIVDGWRSFHGFPTYATDHSTNMYGPLLNVSSGLLFRLFGMNNFVLRFYELSCYCGAAAILAFAVVPKGWRLQSFAILTLANIRSGDFWAMAHPDGAAILFVAIFIVLAYQNRTLLACCALVAAILFKQPSAMAAAIPVIASFPRPKARDFAPLFVVGATLLMLRLAFPLVYYYSFTVPRAAPYIWYRFAKAPIDLLVGLPLLLVALSGWCPCWDKRERWLLSAMTISFSAGAIMLARAGCGPNSYMIFIFAALAFCCYRLPFVDGKLALYTLGILLTACAYSAVPIGASGEHHGDNSYPSAIALVRSLPGTVVCPEDPTIPLYAKGYAGTSLSMEMDETNRSELPPRVRNEVKTADWILTLDNVFGGKRMNDAELSEMGFRPVNEEPLRGSSYKLWHKTVKACGDMPLVPGPDGEPTCQAKPEAVKAK